MKKIYSLLLILFALNDQAGASVVIGAGTIDCATIESNVETALENNNYQQFFIVPCLTGLMTGLSGRGVIKISSSNDITEIEKATIEFCQKDKSLKVYQAAQKALDLNEKWESKRDY